VEDSQRGGVLLRLFCRPILAPQWTPAPLRCLRGHHPRWRSPPAFTVSCGQALNHDDGFLDLRALFAEFGQHFENVHEQSLAYRAGGCGIFTQPTDSSATNVVTAYSTNPRGDQRAYLGTSQLLYFWGI